VYVTAITTAGGNTAVIATYFHVALSGPARTWLMNLAPGSIYSWKSSARGLQRTSPALTNSMAWRPTSTQ
jgi:L-asparaginase II